MKAYTAFVLMTMVLAALGAGCGQPAATAVDNPMRVGVSDLKLIRFQVGDLLEEMFFVVEHPPRNPQRIDTRPLTSAHWFECWRPDTRTSRDVAENALHTIRRQVTVHLAAAAAGEPGNGISEADAGTRIEVVVTKQRLALTQSVDASSMTDLYSVYHNRIGVVDNLEAESREGAVWEDLGRDAALEQYILGRLSRRL